MPKTNPPFARCLPLKVGRPIIRLSCIWPMLRKWKLSLLTCQTKPKNWQPPSAGTDDARFETERCSIISSPVGSTPLARAPSHPVAQALLRDFGDSIAAPSANRFGRVSCTVLSMWPLSWPVASI